MSSMASWVELTESRQVFEAWSVEVPAHFAEAFVFDGAYWHAWDDDRSISLTSMLLTDPDGPVAAELIAAQLPELDGTPIRELPPGLQGTAAWVEAIQPARAEMTLSGLLAAHGRVLLVTITSDELDWARGVWLSIRHCDPTIERRSRRARRAARRCH
jgi:hypothetical protein